MSRCGTTLYYVLTRSSVRASLPLPRRRGRGRAIEFEASEWRHVWWAGRCGRRRKRAGKKKAAAASTPARTYVRARVRCGSSGNRCESVRPRRGSQSLLRYLGGCVIRSRRARRTGARHVERWKRPGSRCWATWPPGRRPARRPSDVVVAVGSGGRAGGVVVRCS